VSAHNQTGRENQPVGCSTRSKSVSGKSRLKWPRNTAMKHVVPKPKCVSEKNPTFFIVTPTMKHDGFNSRRSLESNTTCLPVDVPDRSVWGFSIRNGVGRAHKPRLYWRNVVRITHLTYYCFKIILALSKWINNFYRSVIGNFPVRGCLSPMNTATEIWKTKRALVYLIK